LTISLDYSKYIYAHILAGKTLETAVTIHDSITTSGGDY
jgi:hypothetical protein